MHVASAVFSSNWFKPKKLTIIRFLMSEWYVIAIRGSMVMEMSFYWAITKPHLLLPMWVCRSSLKYGPRTLVKIPGHFVLYSFRFFASLPSPRTFFTKLTKMICCSEMQCSAGNIAMLPCACLTLKLVLSLSIAINDSFVCLWQLRGSLAFPCLVVILWHSVSLTVAMTELLKKTQ